MRIEISKGKRGRWRWILRDNAGKFKGVCNVRGFALEEDARSDAYQCFGAGITINGEYGEMFAGAREFSD